MKPFEIMLMCRPVEVPPPELTAPVLTQTSAVGTNPLSWSGVYGGVILGRDTVRLEWRVNGGAWNQDTDHLITSDDLLTGSWDWTLFEAAAPFAGSSLVEVREAMIRDIGEPGEDISAWSNIVSDTMAEVAFPASLYSGGALGFAFDPTDTSTLHQNIDGTGAVASTGDPVGRLDDVSGRGKHFAAVANGSTRPTWDSEGTLVGDGVDDYLFLAEDSGLFDATPSMTMVAAVRGASGQITKSWYAEGNSGTTSPLFIPLTRTASTSSDDTNVSIRDSAGVNIKPGTNLATPQFDDTLRLVTIVLDGTNLSIKMAGTTYSTTIGAYTTTTLNRSALFAFIRTSVADYFAGRIGRFLAINEVLTGTNLTDVQDWVGAPYGLTP
jgi:hypothetical protein